MDILTLCLDWQTTRVFDTTGNLVQDSGNVLTYDYRDLMTGATLNQTYAGAPNNSMDFNYDEAGQRIRKRTYNYWHVWVDGGGGGIGQESIIQSGEGTDDLSMSDSMIQSDSIGVDGSDSDDGFSIQPGGVETNGSSGSGWVDYSQTSEFHYLYDGSVLLGIFDGRDSALEVYANSPSGAVAVYDHNRTTGRYYLLKDQVGSTRVTVNDAGSVVQYINYRPFGVVGESYTTYNEPLKFTGKEWDTFRTFNFDYFGTRYYDAQYGIFATTDPMGDKYPGISLYDYALNNPLKYIDPNGKEVYIKGKDAAAAATALDDATSLDIKYDKKTHKITATGEAKTDADKKLLSAINDSKIIVNLKTTRGTEVKLQDGSKVNLVVGLYDGSKTDAKGQIQTFQYFNISQAKDWEKVGGGTVGQSVLHEVNESFLGGSLYPGQPRSEEGFHKVHDATTAIDPLQGKVQIEAHKDVFGVWHVSIIGPSNVKVELYTR